MGTRRSGNNDTTQIIEIDPSLQSAVPDRRDRGMLTLLTGDKIGGVFPLDGEENVLGRGGDADIKLADEGLSRRHARISRRPSGFFLEDLGSTNGTFVNGQQLSRPHRLEDGDRLQFGKETVLRFSLQDALEHEAAQRAYESTVRDPLTGLHNRRYLRERLDAEFAFALRHVTPLSVMMLDVDHFKPINDTHGHPAGDRVLQAVAEALRRTARAEDTVARCGGEEFVVIARGVEADGAFVFAERIRRTVEGLAVPWESKVIRVTISVGLAQFHRARLYNSPEALLAAADGALYCAKRGGRNKVVVDP